MVSSIFFKCESSLCEVLPLTVGKTDASSGIETFGTIIDEVVASRSHRESLELDVVPLHGDRFL